MPGQLTLTLSLQPITSEANMFEEKCFSIQDMFRKALDFKAIFRKKCVFSWLLLLPSWILRNAALHQVSSMSISSFDKFQKFPRPAQPKLDSCLKRVLMIRNILKVVLLAQMKFKGMYKDADPVYCMQRCWNSWRIMANGYAMDGVESNFVVTSA